MRIISESPQRRGGGYQAKLVKQGQWEGGIHLSFKMKKQRLPVCELEHVCRCAN